MNSRIEILQSAAAIVAVARLIYCRLAGNYGAILAWLILLAISNFLYAILPQQSQAYFWVYVADVPLECLFSILVARELLELIFRQYPGIVTAGRWAMYAGAALAATLAITIIRVFWNGGSRGRSGLFYFEVFQRSIVFSVVIVLFTMLFFITRYPLHLPPNTYVCAGFFSALFLSDAARLLADSLSPHLYNPLIDAVEAIIIAGCLVGWAIFLRPQTVTAPAQAGLAMPGDVEMLRQLDSLNDFLGRAGRR